jgi:hypothetical protein
MTFDPKIRLTESRLEDSDTLGLSFDTHDDALNFADKLVEDSKHWLSVHKLDIVNRYKKHDLNVHVEFTSTTIAGKYHLIFDSVPVRHLKRGVPGNRYRGEAHTLANYGHRTDGSVFIGITELVESPDEVIPSFVRLEPANEVADFLRNFLGETVNSLHEFKLTVANGKVYKLPNKSEHGLIESSAEIVDNVASVPSDAEWHGLNELELVDLMNAVRVRLDNFGVSVLIEGVYLPLQFNKVILCPANAVL